jgi:hypothetical protein
MLAAAELRYSLNKLLIESLLSDGLPKDVPKSTLKILKAANLIFSNLDQHQVIDDCKAG